jgi:hypothetical protein
MTPTLLTYHRKKSKQRYDELLAKGLCPKCGGPRDEAGKVRCSHCRKTERRRRKFYYQSRDGR